MPVSFTGLVAHRNPANLSLRAEAGAFDTPILNNWHRRMKPVDLTGC
jgi:hypothetical protein